MRLDELKFETEGLSRWHWNVRGTTVNVCFNANSGWYIFPNGYRGIHKDWLELDELTAQCVLYELFGNPQG